jgi:small subunit ribosomal protein S18
MRPQQSNSYGNNNNSQSGSSVYVGARAKRQEPQKNRKRRNVLKDARYVDYLDIKFLDRYINDQGKILPRRITGANAFQQRLIAGAIKHARHLALVTFVEQDIA